MKINYGKHSIGNDDIQSVIKSLKSNNITQGENILKFENALKKFFGSKYSTVVSSGTAALHLAGRALNWTKKDTIITTPLTFLASINSIIYSGAKPELVDIDKKTYTIDINKLEDKLKKFKKKNKKISAVIAVDYAGHTCDWRGLIYLKNKYSLKLINDNCHAMGSKYLNSYKYAAKYSDIVTHSYHAVKNFTTGEGGSILTNDKKINDRIQKLRSHSIIRDKKIQSSRGNWFYEVDELGYNYRLTDFQSALGISQLKKLKKTILVKKKIAKAYDKNFQNVEYLITPQVSKYCDHSYHLYPLQIRFDKINISKKKLFKIFYKKGINLQVHYIPIFLQKFYRKNYKFNLDELKNSIDFYKNEISIPIYKELTSNQVEYVINNILKINNLR